MSSSCKVSIMVLGEMGVGKTSLLFRFNKGKFTAYNAITSINRYFKTIRILDTDVELELYDAGGHVRFRDIVKANYKKIEGVLLVYDVTDITSFSKLSSWLTEVREANEKAIVVIVGNKSDTTDTKAVSRSMVKSYAGKEEVEYYECSAKSGENVNQIFERIAERILEVKNIIPSINHSESQNHVDPDPSSDSASINQSSESTTNPDDLPLPPVALVDSTESQPLEPSIQLSNQTVDPSNDQSDTDSIAESDWCFPDLEYLNSRNRTLVDGPSSNGGDDLPPIVPLPEDIIRLHVEKRRENGSKVSCC